MWFKKLLLLIAILILLPALVTLFHLRYQIQRTRTCLVGGEARTSGIYLFNANDGSYIRYKSMSFSGWPSIAQISTILTRSPNALEQPNSNEWMDLLYIQEHNRWCLLQHNKGKEEVLACSNNQGQDINMMPPSGMWTNDVNGNYMPPARKISVSCPASRSFFSFSSQDPSSMSSSLAVADNIRRNPNKVVRSNRNIQFVLERPTTVLLMALNIILAGLYWNYKVQPASVAKIYSKICFQYELWRGFSGATAHFDALHIGFNMMSLYTLGTELEQDYYGSIEFMLYNISLIPITTVIMMALVWMRIHFTRDSQYAETSTVGYSGVLFAWMVIVSLERPMTCPIPMFENVCFQTYSKFGFKFNASPLIQLMVAQVIMKRVSFVGHLAGIVAGFALHWNLFKLEWIQPSVLLPAILLWHYAYVRRIVPVTRVQQESTTAQQATKNDDSTRRPGHHINPRQIKRERNEQFHSILVWLRYALAAVIAVGLVPFGVTSSITWSHTLILALFWFAVDSHGNFIHTDSSEEGLRLATLWRGFVVVNIVTIVTDSMTLSGWIMSRVLWRGPVLAFLVLLTSLALHVVSLSLAVMHLFDTNSIGGGAFVVVFGRTVLDNAKVVGTALVAAVYKRPQGAFEGRGVVLGSGPGNEAASDEEQLLSHVL